MPCVAARRPLWLCYGQGLRCVLWLSWLILWRPGPGAAQRPFIVYPRVTLRQLACSGPFPTRRLNVDEPPRPGPITTPLSLTSNSYKWFSIQLPFNMRLTRPYYGHLRVGWLTGWMTGWLTQILLATWIKCVITLGIKLDVSFLASAPPISIWFQKEPQRVQGVGDPLLGYQWGA